jgi:hypothetical protein
MQVPEQAVDGLVAEADDAVAPPPPSAGVALVGASDFLQWAAPARRRTTKSERVVRGTAAV